MTTNKIPLNALNRIFQLEHSNALLNVANQALKSGWWLKGKETEKFAADFSAYLGAKHCLPVANGTDALEIAIRSLYKKTEHKGHEVITVANAGGYSSIACKIVGLTPIYADIVRSSQLIDINNCVSLLGDNTAMVIVTHLYGGVVDVPLLRSKMDQMGFSHIPILEDCAQAHGASINGKKVGNFGNISTFSFYPTKNLGAFGDGGAIVSNEDDLLEICRKLSQYGWSSKYQVDIDFGRNSRMDEVQAAVLREKLKMLDQDNAKRRKILLKYQNAIPRDLEIVKSEIDSVAHLAIVLCSDRKNLANYMHKLDISTDIHYPILDCEQLGWKNAGDDSRDKLPVSRSSVGQILTLPLFPTMHDEEVDRVCNALANWKRN